MKRVLVLALVVGLVSAANAAVTLVDGPADPINIGETATIMVNSSDDGGYAGWLEIADLTVANYDGMPELTAAGNPNGDSTVTFDAAYPAWYEFTVTSLAPLANPVLAGDHLVATIVGVSEGTTQLILYEDDAVMVRNSIGITVVPEPTTIALLGLGSLLLYRRK